MIDPCAGMSEPVDAESAPFRGIPDTDPAATGESSPTPLPDSELTESPVAAAAPDPTSIAAGNVGNFPD
ncbi:hypothetical protein ACFYTQ_04960 [Nocardia sp. NPDC004068]|uniref:hypothetical protein n=1 Tax=Nocardia sp. NPDC004068 TaxID=3364303 RepID=UPI00368C3081